MKRKRIVIASTTGFHLHHLARELIAMGNEVTFMTYLPNFRVASYQIPKPCHIGFFGELFPSSLRALVRWFGPEAQRKRVELMLQLTDEAIARKIPPCDVFVGLSGMAVLSAEAARARHGALVLIDRGSQHVLSQAAVLGRDPGRGLSQFYIDREMRSYDRADIILIPSSHVRDSFLNHNFPASKLFVNPYGVDTECFRPLRNKEQGRKIAYVGGWTYQKGCDILAAAIKAMPKYEFHHFGVMGDVSAPSAPNLFCHGHTPHYRLAQKLAECDVLVLPSRQDGFGMVILEALSSGLRVVASHRTGAPDLRAFGFDEDSVILVQPDNVMALKMGLEKACSPVDSYEARQHVFEANRHRLSWRGYAERFEQFIDRALPDTALGAKAD